jgi:site-specific DNA-methyltransferase (adenine-specific)
MHFGDWRDVAARWPRPSVLIVDPPYGIDYESNWALGFDRSRHDETRQLAVEIIGDKDTTERDDVLALGWHAAAVFGPARLDRVPPWVLRDEKGEHVEGGDPRAILTWDKGNVGMGDLAFPWRPNTETIAIYGNGWSGKRGSSVLRGTVIGFSRAVVSNGRQHPHEKPLAVVAELVSKAPSGLPIVDSHAGSGTTLLAAALDGRDAYGAEIDLKYREVILGRLAADGIEVVISEAA